MGQVDPSLAHHVGRTLLVSVPPEDLVIVRDFLDSSKRKDVRTDDLTRFLCELLASEGFGAAVNFCAQNKLSFKLLWQGLLETYGEDLTTNAHPNFLQRGWIRVIMTAQDWVRRFERS